MERVLSRVKEGPKRLRTPTTRPAASLRSDRELWSSSCPCGRARSSLQLLDGTTQLQVCDMQGEEVVGQCQGGVRIRRVSRTRIQPPLINPHPSGASCECLRAPPG